jgi:DNA-binding MarR family transcriptional regulator
MPHDESFTIEERLLFGLEQVVQAVGFLFERRSRDSALSPLQLRILMALLKKGVKRTVGGIAEELSLTPATVSDAIAALVKKGFLTKKRRPEDARVADLALSPRGKRLALSQAAPDEMIGLIRTLSKGEQEALLLVLIKMIRGFQDRGMIPIARMCANCQFFSPNAYPDSNKPHHCGFVEAPFGDRELRIECPDYAAPAALNALNMLKE